MNVVFFSLPSPCRPLLRSLAVAVRCSSLPLAERQALVTEAVSLHELAEAYPDCEAELGVIAALDWQTPFSDGCLGGLEFLDDAQWARLQSRIPTMPPGCRYARWQFALDCRLAVLVETNIASLLPKVGEQSNAFLDTLESCGLVPLQE